MFGNRLTLSFALLVLIVSAPPIDAANKASSFEAGSEEAIESTVKKLIADYRTTPDALLSKRISLLETIAELDPDARILRDYKSLEQTNEVLKLSLNQRPDTQDLTTRISDLKPLASILNNDTESKLALLNSPLLSSTKSTTREAIQQGHPATIAAIRDACISAGVWKLFEQPVQESALEAIRSTLSSYRQDEIRPTATQLLEERLLGQRSTQIPITLDIASEDEALSSALEDAIKRRWSGQFNIALNAQPKVPAQYDSPLPPLRSTFKIQPINTDRRETTESASSVIPGRSVVKENPEFAKALYVYKNAELIQQERANQALEYDYGEYRERYSKIQYDLEQEIIQPYIDNEENIPASAYAQVYSETEKQVRLLDIDPPDVDKDFREEALDTLASTPPTITVQEEEQTYEYTKRSIDIAFSSAAEIRLTSSENSGTVSTENVTLELPHHWYVNEGIHARDPTIPKGNFNESKLSSSKDLFILQFTANCSKAFESAIDRFANQYIEAGESSGDANSLSYGLALKLSSIHVVETQLNLDEMIALSEQLSKSPTISDLDSMLTDIALKKISDS